MPVAGLFSVIRSLKDSGLTLSIATSDSASGARATLCPFDVLDQFDFIAGYDSGFGVKPEPAGPALGQPMRRDRAWFSRFAGPRVCLPARSWWSEIAVTILKWASGPVPVSVSAS